MAKLVTYLIIIISTMLPFRKAVAAELIVDIIEQGQVINSRPMTEQEQAVYQQLQQAVQDLKLHQPSLAAITQRLNEREELDSTTLATIANRKWSSDLPVLAKLKRHRKVAFDEEKNELKRCQRNYRRSIDTVAKLQAKLSRLITNDPGIEFVIRTS